MKARMNRTLGATAALVAMGWCSVASADGLFAHLWNQTTFNGVLRADAAFRTTGDQNHYNQGDAPWQNVDVPRQAYVPPDLGGLVWGAVPLTVVPGGPINDLIQDLFPGLPNVIQLPGADTVRRNEFVHNYESDLNLMHFRFTGEMETRFSRDWRMNIRFRAVYDPTIYDEFDTGDVAQFQGGIPGYGNGTRYADNGKPNYFEAKGQSGRNLNPLEIAGRNYMIDLPTFIINYKTGSFDFRFGNQQIAWGQAIFFRTFDVANGLDLRRHLVIDRAVEEFEDERVAKIALRGTVQATDAIIVDAFIGKFQPDVLPNPNTPYNVIPVQFYRPFDNYHTGGYDTKLDYGIRLKADYGTIGWQAMAVSRYNPLGAFKWMEGGIEKGLVPAGGLIGAVVETAYSLKPRCGPNQSPYDNFCRLYDNAAEALSHTPFVVAPAGLYSAREWYAAAGSVRLNGTDALNTAIAEFPALRDLFASPVENVEQAQALLDTFFIGSGNSLRGHVERDYFREEVFGLGAMHVFETADLESFWNQFIVNLEVQYTPERVLTSTSLSRHYQKTDEYIVTLVGEKWYRWTEAFPAAYLVFQYMHRSETDLVGLSLKGYGGHVGGGDLDLNDPIVVADGLSSANYLVFAGFQPWPNRKYIAEWAFLYDVEGGLLAQPLIKWNPGYGVSVDLFYNYVNGKVHGDGTKTLQRAFDWADEVGLRISYQF